MEELLSLAARLGREIGAHPRTQAFTDAAKAVAEDRDAQRVLADYQKQVEHIRRLEAEQKPIEVADKHVIKDGKREVHAYHIESAHSIGTLMGYVPDAKLGFIVDIWSANAPLPPKPTAGHREVVAGVKKWGLTPERFAHGHGSPSEYAPFAKFVGN